MHTACTLGDLQTAQPPTGDPMATGVFAMGCRTPFGAIINAGSRRDAREMSAFACLYPTASAKVFCCNGP